MKGSSSNTLNLRWFFKWEMIKEGKMLRIFTVETLQKITESFVQNIDFLTQHCPGILKNELHKAYVNGEDHQDQESIKQNLMKLSDDVIPRVNKALKTEKTEMLRSALDAYYQTIENIFQASLKVHLAHEIPFQGGLVGSDPTKGRHLNALENIIQESQRAREALYQDHNLRGETAATTKLGDAICASIKSLSHLIGYQVKADKNHKIVDLINPTTHLENLAKQFKH